MKKLFLSIMMMVPCLAHAYDVKVDGIYYNLDRSAKTASVTRGDVDYETGERDEYEGDVVIPENVKAQGLTFVVESIDEWAMYDNKKVTSVSLPNTLKRIGECAFYG